MATNTYIALDKVTVGSAVSSVTLNMGSTISQSYSNLVIVGSHKNTASIAGIAIRFNGDTGTHYSSTLLYGTGSAAGSSRYTNQTQIPIGYTSTSEFAVLNCEIFNYSSTTAYKTLISRGGSASYEEDTIVGNWRGSTGSSTEAITSITLTATGGNIAAGSTFSLYGIHKGTAIGATAKASGGTITYGVDGYTYHTFTGSGTFTPSQSITADVLIVAGGGGGGGQVGGGGGAGGVVALTSQSLTAQGYSVTVGSGGAGGGYPYLSTSTRGSNGENSSFASTSATGGGGAGGYFATGYAYGNGSSGGSGGGSGGNGGTNSNTGGAASPSGQGNAGGNSASGVIYYMGGGGGGAGSAGTSVTSNDTVGTGGVGTSEYSQWGRTTNTGQSVGGIYYYAGGGGGHASNNRAIPGGYGGGGAGATTNGGGNVAGTAGTANTGGGGGGSRDVAGGAGGSGVVIVRYVS